VKTYEIKHRYTDAVLYSGQGESLREVVIAAISAGANLADAYLADAYLAGANLAGANLARANLAGAYLAGARNIPEIPEVADPATPYKRAVTDEEREQRRLDRMAMFRARNPDVPVIDKLDAKILAAVTKGGGQLNMGSWHSCETMHCRAGWAIHLAGKDGYALEQRYGSHHAGRMLYIAATGRVPHFFAPNDVALEDIRRCAAEAA
jgi:hypothetical protein